MQLITNNHLAELRQRVRLLEKNARPKIEHILPFGDEEIDRHLPHGGLELGALHEVSAEKGIIHETAATNFVGGILARMMGPVLWCFRKQDLFTPGLALVGLHPDRIIFAEAEDEKTLLIIMEEGLQHRGLAAVIGEVSYLSLVASRRLHLAARSSGVTAFALHRQSKYQKDVKEPTAAETRWRLTALPSEDLPAPGIGRAFWHIELTRCRDGEGMNWIRGACDEKGYLNLPANLAHRQITDRFRRAHA